MRWISLIYVLMVTCGLTAQTGLKWSFKQGGDRRWLPAKVPGSVHMDLYANGFILDPFIDDQEDTLSWIGEKDWEYKTTLTLTEHDLQTRTWRLVFDGIDTYADVFINEQKVYTSENMFHGFKIMLNPYVNAGENEVKVLLKSTMEEGRKRLEEVGYSFPADNDIGDPKISPVVRKAAYHFGWDWAPRFVTMGIWGDVHLESFEENSIEDCHVNLVSLEDSVARLQVRLDLFKRGEYELVVIDTSSGEELGRGIMPGKSGVVNFTIQNPKRWWPNGWGDPHLYGLAFQLKKNDSIAVAEKVKRVGLRTVYLVEQPEDLGKSFYFSINGHPCFMRGANYIPQDVFLGRVTVDHYEKIILAAKEANLNMLRVWGGGIYEKDIFYDLCDEHGIMVWQDFMFANTMYPSNEAFYKSVSGEVDYQIKRLRHHPSIIHWNGNNEIDVAWKNWGWQDKYKLSPAVQNKMLASYNHIFQKVIPVMIRLLDGRSYTHTSPQSNWGKFGNFISGTMHYWGVWHGKEDFEAFGDNVGRFMNEYGFQSYPSNEFMRHYDTVCKGPGTAPYRQKSYIGDEEILKQIDTYFGLGDSSELDYLSQLTQAYALEKAITAHRINTPHCMGSLFWQWNDCWPGASWSVLHYGGGKKMAYPVVKQLFEPVQAFYTTDQDSFKLYVVNDKPSAFSGEVEMEFFPLDPNSEIVSSLQTFEVKLEPGESSLVFAGLKSDLVKGAEPNQIHGIVSVSASDSLIARRDVILVKPKELDLHAPEQLTTLQLNQGNTVRHMVKSPCFMYGVQVKDEKSTSPDELPSWSPGVMRPIANPKVKIKSYLPLN